MKRESDSLMIRLNEWNRKIWIYLPSLNLSCSSSVHLPVTLPCFWAAVALFFDRRIFRADKSSWMVMGAALTPDGCIWSRPRSTCIFKAPWTWPSLALGELSYEPNCLLRADLFLGFGWVWLSSTCGATNCSLALGSLISEWRACCSTNLEPSRTLGRAALFGSSLPSGSSWILADTRTPDFSARGSSWIRKIFRIQPCRGGKWFTYIERICHLGKFSNSLNWYWSDGFRPEFLFLELLNKTYRPNYSRYIYKMRL